MAQKTNFTEIVHDFVRESEDPLALDDIIAHLKEQGDSKNPRSTARSIIRTSGLIKSVGGGRYSWLSHCIRGARMRHTLTVADFEQRALHWDYDLLTAIWPALSEPGSRRDREPVSLSIEGGEPWPVEPNQNEGGWQSTPPEGFWAWVAELNARPGDDLLFTATEHGAHGFALRLVKRDQRDRDQIEERNRSLKRKLTTILGTKRGKVAPPDELVRELLAEGFYKDSVPPQSLSNLLPDSIVEEFGLAVEPDDLDEIPEVPSNVIPFPRQRLESDDDDDLGLDDFVTDEGSQNEYSGSASFEIRVPRHTGLELPDLDAYQRAYETLASSAEIGPALALHVLGISPLCSSAYVFLSRSTEFEDEALELAGAAVLAAERRLAHQIIESAVTGADLNLEDSMDEYLQARGFLARMLWLALEEDAAVEQAMHCFELAPEDPAVREDLFHMLLESERGELLLELLERFPTSQTESLYHRAYLQLMKDPECKDGAKLLRKAVRHNDYLASLLLGEEPGKTRKSLMEEAESFETAYGHLWRREDFLFDLLEESVLAKR